MLYFGRVGNSLGHCAFFGSSWGKKVITQKKKKKKKKSKGVARGHPQGGRGWHAATPKSWGWPLGQPEMHFRVFFFHILFFKKISFIYLFC
jgi:hypothetical protein